MTREVQHISCSTEQLTLFYYAELDEASERQLEQHLQLCSHCRSELADLRATLKFVSSAVPELSAGEVQKFTNRVMKNLPRRRFNRPVLGWALAGAAALMLILSLQPQIEILIPVPAREAVPLMAEQEVASQLELLQTLDLLENLDLLQQLAGQG